MAKLSNQQLALKHSKHQVLLSLVATLVSATSLFISLITIIKVDKVSTISECANILQNFSNLSKGNEKATESAMPKECLSQKEIILLLQAIKNSKDTNEKFMKDAKKLFKK